MPSIDEDGEIELTGRGQPRARETLSVLLQGRFQSAFDSVPPQEPPAGNGDDESTAADAAAEQAPTALISRSPESARLVVVASNDFASDQVLSGVIAAAGTQYFGPLEFLMNAVDWALEDSALMSIRSRAHFNRTLPPLEQSVQAQIEYGNYVLALALLAGLYGLWRLQRGRRRAQLARELSA
jgi:ABC-2 type transport system permease protein